MPTIGIHFGHGSSASAVDNGLVLAEVNEERFNRVKHSFDIPRKAYSYCMSQLDQQGLEADQIAIVGSRRHLEGFREMFAVTATLDNADDFADLSWSHLQKQEIAAAIEPYHLKDSTSVKFVEHHLAHAANAFYQSGFHRSLVITADGSGDDRSICAWIFDQQTGWKKVVEFDTNASIGWFYSNVTQAIGFEHGDGEGKTMGLAPYGDASVCYEALERYCPSIRNYDLQQKPFFSKLKVSSKSGRLYFAMNEAEEIRALADTHGREHIAAAAQRILEERITTFVSDMISLTGEKSICVSGGLFLNVCLNRKIGSLAPKEQFYVSPNPGDPGLALGAALLADASQTPRSKPRKRVEHTFWGPEYQDEEIIELLKVRKIAFRRSETVEAEVAHLLANGMIVGWFQGRMEAGPRALGNRSILMDPGTKNAKDILNSCVKFRESFRPFCPSILDRDADYWLADDCATKYMSTNSTAKPEMVEQVSGVVHIDRTTRVQIVDALSNPKFHRLLECFKELTGRAVLLNTSFNLAGEPIVMSPRDAIRSFYDSGIQVLVLNNLIITKHL